MATTNEFSWKVWPRLSNFLVTHYLYVVSLVPANWSATVPQGSVARHRLTRAIRLTHREVSVNEAEGKIDSTSAAGLLGHTVDPMVLRCTAHDQDAARSQWKLRHLARRSLTKFKCSRRAEA